MLPGLPHALTRRPRRHLSYSMIVFGRCQEERCSSRTTWSRFDPDTLQITAAAVPASARRRPETLPVPAGDHGREDHDGRGEPLRVLIQSIMQGLDTSKCGPSRQLPSGK
jgi:hypothetical protein